MSRAAASTQKTKPTSTPSNPIGRPSKYDPIFDQKVIELGKQGKSIEQMACILEVGMTSFKRWREEYPSFRTSLDEAQHYELQWWEDLAQNHLINVPGGKILNTGLWSRSMAARFPNKYSDRSKVEVSGKEGAPIQVEHFNSALDGLLAVIKRKAYDE